MFELTYIHHDCFLLETPRLGVIFDYWMDPSAEEVAMPRWISEFPKEKPLYVLVSHFHKDHFNRDIFGWEAVHPLVRYVISKDVEKHIKFMLRPDSSYKGRKINPDHLTVLKKGDCFEDSDLRIDCFGSTDIGNSYALTLKEDLLKVFHAGDLNCWTWRDESTPEEIASAENAFLAELAPIQRLYPELDVAMFPVDSRIGTEYYEGARIFLNKINVKRFFPMHFTLADNDDERERRIVDALDFKSYSPGHGDFIGLTKTYDKYGCFNTGFRQG